MNFSHLAEKANNLPPVIKTGSDEFYAQLIPIMQTMLRKGYNWKRIRDFLATNGIDKAEATLRSRYYQRNIKGEIN